MTKKKDLQKGLCSKIFLLRSTHIIEICLLRVLKKLFEVQSDLLGITPSPVFLRTQTMMKGLSLKRLTAVERVFSALSTNKFLYNT